MSRSSPETSLRTCVKAVSWQVLGLFTSSFIGFLITGSFSSAGLFAIGSALMGLVCYVVHERLWLMVPWGLKQHSQRST